MFTKLTTSYMGKLKTARENQRGKWLQGLGQLEMGSEAGHQGLAAGGGERASWEGGSVWAKAQHKEAEILPTGQPGRCRAVRILQTIRRHVAGRVGGWGPGRAGVLTSSPCE